MGSVCRCGTGCHGRIAAETRRGIGNEDRLLHPGHCTLSAYISSHETGIETNTGYISNDNYVSPLHVPAIVVGHRHSRVAVCNTGTTTLLPGQQGDDVAE